MRPTLAACFLAASYLSFVHATAQPTQPVPAPRFAETGVVSSNEGHATLRWGLPAQSDHAATISIFELEESRDPDFGDHRLRHRGPERAYFVSGLLNGRNYFRVRAVPAGSEPGPWSDVLAVKVDYPERGQVLLLLVVGCLVFVGTIATITLGWLRSRHAGLAENRTSA